MNLFGRFSGKKKGEALAGDGGPGPDAGIPLIAKPPACETAAPGKAAKPVAQNPPFKSLPPRAAPARAHSTAPAARPVMPLQMVKPNPPAKPVMPARSVTLTPAELAKAAASAPVKRAPEAKPAAVRLNIVPAKPAAAPANTALPAKQVEPKQQTAKQVEPKQLPPEPKPLAVTPSVLIAPPEEIPQDRFAPLRDIPGFDMAAYQKMIERPPPKCIRVNTLKIAPQELKERLTALGWKLHQVPWYDNAFWVDAESPGSTLEHCLGYYYVQDAGSMAAPMAFKGVYQLAVLDLCAAPGAKTTMLSQMMRNSGVVVANDASSGRIRPLAMSVQRMGATNCVVTHTDGRNLPNWGKGKFDCVLVDAPCSGFGQVREIANGAERGAPEKYTKLQKDLILAGYDCLKPGGELVYSTCTFTVEENEAVVQHLLDNRAAVVMDLEIGLRHADGITGKPGLSGELSKCARIYPWQNATDGFFICKVKKGYIPEAKKPVPHTGSRAGIAAGVAAAGAAIGIAERDGPARERTAEEIMIDDVFEGSLGEEPEKSR